MAHIHPQIHSRYVELPVKLRITICEATIHRYQDRIKSFEKDDKYVETLMSSLDEYDVTSDRYYILMSQRIGLWADIEEVKEKISAENEKLQNLLMEQMFNEGLLVEEK